MKNEFPFPKWFCKLLSYISAFTCGMYTYATINGNPPEKYRVILTLIFGTIFYIASLPEKQ